MWNYLFLKIALAVSLSGLGLDQVHSQHTEGSQPNTISYKPINTDNPINFSPDKQKRWIKIDEVVVETFNIALTPIEEQLARAESGEVKALIKRDTTALKNIWLQDFTLDEQLNRVHYDPNPLPHYLSLNRKIEKILVIDNRAYVSGMEYAVQVQDNNKVNTQVTRKYVHLWKKELFGWKLATKTYE